MRNVPFAKSAYKGPSGVAHRLAILAKSEWVLSINLISMEGPKVGGPYSKSSVAAPCQWLSLPGKTCSQDDVRSRTFLVFSLCLQCFLDGRGKRTESTVASIFSIGAVVVVVKTSSNP